MKIKTAIFVLAVCWYTVECEEPDTRWSSFLESLSNYLSGPSVQLNITKFAVANLEDWGKCKQTCGLVLKVMPYINITLQHINDYSHRKNKLTEREEKEFTDTLKSFLESVHAYRTTPDLDEILKDSRGNFTNNTLDSINNWITGIKETAENTGCTTLYRRNLHHCVDVNSNTVPHITGKNFKDFIHLLKQGDNATFFNFLCWANTKVNDDQLKQINDILILKLNSTPKASCRENRKIISGEIIRIRDVIPKAGKCKSNTSNEDIVAIMASDTIYIDDDIDFKGRNNALLAIMAPTVVVVGERKIVLDGNDDSKGEKYPRGLEYLSIDGAKELSCFQIIHGTEDGTNKECIENEAIKRYTDDGISSMTAIHYYLRDEPDKRPNNPSVRKSPHGAPGSPGQTGGSFFGLANVFENSSKLTITSNGGKGGFGQHGAHGLKGESDHVCLHYEKNCKDQNVIWNKKENGLIVDHRLNGSSIHKSMVDAFKNITSKPFNSTFKGSLATKGSNGGNGGAGGSGGNPGQIQIIALNRNDSFRKYALKGQTGVPGMAGSGGSGGETGGHTEYIVVRWYEYDNLIEADVRAMRSKKTLDSGNDGISGNNTQGIKSPTPPVDIATNLGTLIADYQTILKTSLENRFNTSKIYKHLMSILLNKELTRNCSTSSIIKDLLEYENAFFRWHDKINYTEIYLTLMNQTESKVESIAKPEEKKALHYTYTAILSKLYAIKNHAVEKYIANLNHFLNMFMEKLNKYKEVKKELAIIEETVRFKAEIDKQIEDANNVISNSIQPKLEKLFEKIDSEVEELKSEVDQKEEELLAERKRLEKQKEEMKKNFLARLFGNILKFIGAIVSCLGPIGMAAGTAIGTAGMLVTKFGVNQDAYQEPEVSDLGARLNPFMDQFDGAKQQKDLLLEDMDNVINHFTGAHKDFMDVYHEAKNAYEDIKETATTVMDTYHEINKTYHTVLDDFKTMREKLRNNFGDLNTDTFKEFKDTYENVKKKFNSAVRSVETHFSGAKKVFKRINKGFKTVKAVFSKVENAVATVKNTMTTVKKAFDSSKQIFSAVTSVATKTISVVQQGGAIICDAIQDKSQMDKINRALAINAENIKSIRRFRKQIDDSLKPMLAGMKNTVNNFPKMCEGKSEAQLMTAGWQVDQALENILCAVGQMTKEFHVGESFKTTITSIKEAVKLMTNIFRKIQDYGEKKKLADHYMITQMAGSDIDLKDPQLRADVTNLTVAIQANLLLYDYRVWVKQIKLFVFPLPQTYLQTFKVPMVLRSDDNSLKGYMTNAIDEVNRFRSQYIESNVYINKFDNLKHRGFFYNDTQLGPFYVWKNKEHAKSISRLLAGESVVFEALTLRRDMNALKFRRIDLFIRANNKEDQTRLNDVLKNYRVRMKHIGNNYYNCDNITYVATVVGQSFKFSYQYINREPVDVNLVYEKILHGDYMLSPYTTWYIKLINVSTFGYKPLRPFHGAVDVELSGEGEYFENKPEVCEDDLSEYFQMKDQFVKKKKKVFDECPPAAIVERGFLCCEYNDTFDPNEKYWCRAIVRKPEMLEQVHNTSEDKNYYYYDRYFRKSVLSADDLETKFRDHCTLELGNIECIKTFKNRQAYRPWFFYHDKAGGPFPRGYLFCHLGQCLARIQKRKGELKGLKYTHEDDRFYFYATLFSESVIQKEDHYKYERCSPSDPDCAPAFENSTLLKFQWGTIPNEFVKKNKT